MEIMELATMLGQAIKADPRAVAMENAMAAYNTDEGLQGLMLEFNVQQTALQEEYKKPEIDQAIIESIENRMNELVGQITASQVYVAAAEAQKAMDDLMGEVYGEIEFQITGHRPCSHDCGSCGSDCGHNH
ncbi:MAG: YlbF family regulator [Clostridia bacterium]|nr:YlbF family regulator [Clostridia bacterium]MBR2296826.1 YlbF family regulator [Clostridia bacterium]